MTHANLLYKALIFTYRESTGYRIVKQLTFAHKWHTILPLRVECIEILALWVCGPSSRDAPFCPPVHIAPYAPSVPVAVRSKCVTSQKKMHKHTAVDMQLIKREMCDHGQLLAVYSLNLWPDVCLPWEDFGPCLYRCLRQSELTRLASLVTLVFDKTQGSWCRLDLKSKLVGFD